MAAIAAMCLLTAIRCETWRSEFLLWQDAAAKSPESPGARLNVAREYHRNGNFIEAVRQYQLAMQLAASRKDFKSRDILTTGQTDLARLFLTLGFTQDAENVLRATLTLIPNFGPAAVTLSDIYNTQHRYAESITVIDEALVAGFGPGFSELGHLYFNKAVALCMDGFSEQSNRLFNLAAKSLAKEAQCGL